MHPTELKVGQLKRFVQGLLVVLACTSIGLMTANQALGQGAVTSATIVGNVTDQRGGVLPRATVVVRNQGTGLTRQTITDDSGQFIVVQLPTGTYEVSVELTGFKKAIIRDLVLNVGAEEMLKIALQVGELVESIEVSAQEVQTIEITKTEVSGVIQEVQLKQLPLNQRSFTELVIQQPGLVLITNTPPPSPVASLSNVGSYISAGGQIGSSVAYLMDGVNINNSGFGAPGTVVGGDIPGVEAIQEFKVLTHNYSAAYGGAAGAVVSFATRGGTNAFHGNVYEYLRNDALDARGPFDTLDRTGDGKGDVPPFRRNQFGATVGGPINRDKTFFFTNYEGLRQRLTTTSVGFVPSLAARNGGLGGTSGFPVIGPILQPDGTYQRGPVAIPDGVRALLELYPLPNGPDFGNGIALLSFADNQPTRQDFSLVKIDHNLSEKDLLSARYSIIDGDGSSAFRLPTFSFQRETRLQNFLLKWTRTISPSVVNTASVGFMRSFNLAFTPPTVPVGPRHFTGNPDRQIVGTIAVGSSIAAAATPGALTTMGNDPLAPSQVVKNYFSFNDDLIVSHGGHAFKVGGMVQRNQDNMIRPQLFGGNWVFNNVNDFLAGNPGSLLIFNDGGNPSFGYRTTLFAWYAEDAWRARPNFTITLGLRHEFQVPILKEVNNKLGNFLDPNLASAEETIGKVFNNYSLKQFQPRVGIAYAPFKDGKMVIRAGAGIFNSFISLNDLGNFTTFHAPRMVTSFFVGNPATGRAPIPFPACPSCAVPTPFPGLAAVLRNPVKSPTSVQWHLEIERQLLGNLKLSATYAGAQSSHIIRTYEGNHNLQCNVNGKLIFSPQCGKAAPAFGSIAFAVLGRGYDTNSPYHAGTLALSRVFSRGLTFNTSYTFAKAISQSDIPNSATMTGISFSTQLPPDYKLDRSESAFSVRHRWTINAIYELPFGQGRRFLGNVGGLTEALLGGWTINALGTFQSGFPFSVLAGFGITGVGDNIGRPDRPHMVGKPKLGRVDRWFNPKAYVLQDPGILGNAPRTSARGPGFNKLDFSLGKRFDVGERVGVEFRAEFFNISNHPNFALPFNQIYIGNFPQFRGRVPTQAELDALPCNLTAEQAQVHSCNPLAGRISSIVGTPRQIQFGLKVTF